MQCISISFWSKGVLQGVIIKFLSVITNNIMSKMLIIMFNEIFKFKLHEARKSQTRQTPVRHSLLYLAVWYLLIIYLNIDQSAAPQKSSQWKRHLICVSYTCHCHPRHRRADSDPCFVSCIQEWEGKKKRGGGKRRTGTAVLTQLPVAHIVRPLRSRRPHSARVRACV